MIKLRHNLRQAYRLWVSRYDNWAPARWDDVPPQAVALEAAVDGVYSAAQAAAFVEGFNTEMLRDPQHRWAVAVPVRVRYDGDLHPGQRFTRRMVSISRGEESAA